MVKKKAKIKKILFNAIGVISGVTCLITTTMTIGNDSFNLRLIERISSIIFFVFAFITIYKKNEPIYKKDESKIKKTVFYAIGVISGVICLITMIVTLWSVPFYLHHIKRISSIIFFAFAFIILYKRLKQKQERKKS